MGSRTCATAWLQTAVVVLAAARASAQSASPPDRRSIAWQYGAFIDVGRLFSSTSPSNHLFRNRGTTPRLDEWDLNMTAAYLKKAASETARLGVEVTVQEGRDSETFGFSATAPNIGGAHWLLHLGPTNVSYLAPVGNGLTVQGGIFAQLTTLAERQRVPLSKLDRVRMKVSASYTSAARQAFLIYARGLASARSFGSKPRSDSANNGHA